MLDSSAATSDTGVEVPAAGVLQRQVEAAGRVQHLVETHHVGVLQALHAGDLPCQESLGLHVQPRFVQDLQGHLKPTLRPIISSLITFSSSHMERVSLCSGVLRPPGDPSPSSSSSSLSSGPTSEQSRRVVPGQGSGVRLFGRIRIDEALDQAAVISVRRRNDQVRKNRDILRKVIIAALYLARQEQAFRGHDESASSSNRGNIVELLHAFAEFDTRRAPGIIHCLQRYVLQSKTLDIRKSHNRINSTISALRAIRRDDTFRGIYDEAVQAVGMPPNRRKRRRRGWDDLEQGVNHEEEDEEDTGPFVSFRHQSHTMQPAAHHMGNSADITNLKKVFSLPREFDYLEAKNGCQVTVTKKCCSSPSLEGKSAHEGDHYKATFYEATVHNKNVLTFFFQHKGKYYIPDVKEGSLTVSAYDDESILKKSITNSNYFSWTMDNGTEWQRLECLEAPGMYLGLSARKLILFDPDLKTKKGAFRATCTTTPLYVYRENEALQDQSSVQ
ncbi:hypothetical protein CRUP_032179 [Coryphaenoides rupestris]|nr:hypothetical protein CRUP_032179 [Coryphaenoides rupestris]